MLALEISINTSTPFVVAADYLTFVDLTIGTSTHNVDSVLVEGADDGFLYIWLHEKVQNGDQIFIRIVDVDKDKLSSPKEIKKRDREQMRQEFERLKEDLQNKKLL